MWGFRSGAALPLRSLIATATYGVLVAGHQRPATIGRLLMKISSSRSCEGIKARWRCAPRVLKQTAVPRCRERQAARSFAPLRPDQT